MHVSIRSRPAYAIAYLVLDAGEQVFVERGAMAAMSSGVHVSAGLASSSLAKAALRHAVGGESLVFARYEAEFQGAWVGVTPRYPGDVELVRISPDAGFFVQTGSVLAHNTGVDTSITSGGLRSMLIQEGVVFIHARGDGDLLLSAYGGIDVVDVQPGESVIIDTGHLVAMSDSMRFKVGPLGSLTASALTGEGLVAKIEGPGKVLLQTRAEQALRSWLFPTRGHNTRM